MHCDKVQEKISLIWQTSCEKCHYSEILFHSILRYVDKLIRLISFK